MANVLTDIKAERYVDTITSGGKDRLCVDANLTVGSLTLGAVTIEDQNSGVRADVEACGVDVTNKNGLITLPCLVVRDDVLTTLAVSDGSITKLRTDSKGALWVNISDDIDFDIRDLSHTQDSIKIGDGSDFLAVNVDGSINVVSTATDLDIRDLTHVSDSIKIGDGTDFLAINADGSINVNVTGATDSAYNYAGVNLVKNTPTTVVSESPTSDKSFDFIIVSGEGLCEWNIKFGTTSSEATIISIWTTPSSPTQTINLPDSLIVSSGETLLVEGINRENPSSPTSDFEGKASIVKKA